MIKKNKIFFSSIIFLIMYSFTFTTVVNALEEEALNTNYLLNFRQPYPSSIDLFDLQKSVDEYQCISGLPINIYDPKIIYSQGCHVLLLKHHENENEIKVVFKPRNKLVQALSIGAFYTARYLGMNTLIPPIASYQYQGKEGVISYFVDTSPENTFWEIPGDIELIKNSVHPKSLSDYYVFCYLLGNWDLKWKNTVLLDRGQFKDIVCVDVDAIASPGVGPYGEHFFVPWVRFSRNVIPYSIFKEEDAFFMSQEDVDFHLDRLFPLFESSDIVQKEPVTSKKYALVSKLAKSFAFWERPPTKHYIDAQAWWIKLYDHMEGVAPAFTQFADKDILERLISLNIYILKTLFNDTDPYMPLVNEEFYIGILERRDAMCQVLK